MYNYDGIGCIVVTASGKTLTSPQLQLYRQQHALQVRQQHLKILQSKGKTSVVVPANVMVSSQQQVTQQSQSQQQVIQQQSQMQTAQQTTQQRQLVSNCDMENGKYHWTRFKVNFSIFRSNR